MDSSGTMHPLTAMRWLNVSEILFNSVQFAVVIAKYLAVTFSWT